MVSRQLDSRQSASSPKPLVAIDLDGTFTTGNTLHLFAKCALTDAMRRLRMLRASRIVGWLALRKLHLIPHITMKNGILKAAEQTPTLKKRFRKGVEAMLSPQAEKLLKDYESKGYQILLATAASEIYVTWIWEGDYIATPPYGTIECRGEEKRRRVEEYARENGLITRAAITDHYDDIPILTIPTLTERILLSPTPKTLSQLPTHIREVTTILPHNP